MTEDDYREIRSSCLTEDDIAKTHPGFTVVCDKCGSKRVITHDDRGYSEDSGAWGDVNLWCLECGQSTALADAG